MNIDVVNINGWRITRHHDSSMTVKPPKGQGRTISLASCFAQGYTAEMAIDYAKGILAEERALVPKAIADIEETRR